MHKIIVEIGRTLGKAVLAGVGVELARLASLALRKRLDPDEKDDEQSPEELKAENEKLKEELQKLKSELEAVRAPEPK